MSRHGRAWPTAPGAAGQAPPRSDLVRAAMRILAELVTRHREDRHVAELVVVLVLIIVITVLAFTLLGDVVADLISLIGGYVDERTLSE